MDKYQVPQTRSTIGMETSASIDNSSSMSWSCDNARIIGFPSMPSCGKRKRDLKEELEMSKKFKAEEEGISS